MNWKYLGQVVDGNRDGLECIKFKCAFDTLGNARKAKCMDLGVIYGQVETSMKHTTNILSDMPQ